ncbi:hypothetical protein RvY_18246 [Ramazzottius varieornatus]|uniref:Tetraspanin n=1 Tax=Ramazzottius varieornatus TaxID=947166 RepID=A0A1D1W522_RAMVA|nr:hypothetical protein RvY_18246 [Ramazzottius varieornatus]
MAMDRYVRSLEMKRSIDEMQLELQCCGSKGAGDWFNITWIDNAYLDLKSAEVKAHMRDGAYKGPNVPFSCCSVRATRPCIHRNVTGAHAHYSWPMDSTLNSIGCAAALATEFGATTLSVVGYILLATFILMVSSLVFLKLLATAIANTYPWGDPEGQAPTWLMEECPIGMCNTETPQPLEDVPVAMPGAKAPAKKQRTNGKETKIQPPPGGLDTDDEDAVDVPLLRRASTEREQHPQQYARSGNISPYSNGNGYSRAGGHEQSGGYHHGNGYASDHGNMNRYDKQGYQASPSSAPPSRRPVGKKQAKFTGEEDETDNLVTDLTSDDDEGATTSKGGTTTTQGGDTNVSDGGPSGGGGGGGGGSGKKDKKGDKDGKKKGDKKGGEKDKKGKGKDGKDKKRGKSKDKKGKSKDKKKKGGSKTKKKKAKKKKKSKKRK